MGVFCGHCKGALAVGRDYSEAVHMVTRGLNGSALRMAKPVTTEVSPLIQFIEKGHITLYVF